MCIRDRYLSGREVEARSAADGWCCVTVDGWPLGGGKVSGGRVKNHYPKALRLLDVYKRQPVLLLLVLVPELYRKHGCEQRRVAVSYTHLDVYKRQWYLQLLPCSSSCSVCTCGDCGTGAGCHSCGYR